MGLGEYTLKIVFHFNYIENIAESLPFPSQFLDKFHIPCASLKPLAQKIKISIYFLSIIKSYLENRMRCAIFEEFDDLFNVTEELCTIWNKSLDDFFVDRVLRMFPDNRYEKDELSVDILTAIRKASGTKF